MPAYIDIKTGTGPIDNAGYQVAAYQQADKENPAGTIVYDDFLHKYTLDGNPIPGVTTVINEFFPFPVEFISEELLFNSSAYGSAVHLATSLDDQGTLDESSLDPLLHGPVEGWRKFKVDMKVKILQNEKIVFSRRRWYAGRLDRVIEWSTKKITRAVINLSDAGYKIIPLEKPADINVFNACTTLYNEKIRRGVL